MKSKIFAAFPSVLAFKKAFECIEPDYANRIENIQTAPEASVIQPDYKAATVGTCPSLPIVNTYNIKDDQIKIYWSRFITIFIDLMHSTQCH